MERHGLAQQILAEMNRYLVLHGMVPPQDIIANVTLIAAVPSTKNRAKATDPESEKGG